MKRKGKTQFGISHRPSTSKTRISPQIEINGAWFFRPPSCPSKATSQRRDPQRWAFAALEGDAVGEAGHEDMEAEKQSARDAGSRVPEAGAGVAALTAAGDRACEMQAAEDTAHRPS